MRRQLQAVLLGLAAIATTACSTQGWMGADAEKTYDAELNAKRLAETLNNDDYYELTSEGRIYVFSDAKDYKTWVKTGEVPKVVTKFRAGPNGETVKFSLTGNETKAMEKIAGFKGGAQNMYEGNVPGLVKGFFGFVKKDDTYFVFDNWNALLNFKKTGEASGTTEATGPGGAKVTYVGYTSLPKDLATRFAALHDGK